MPASFNVTDQYELVALHRALFEAQFAAQPHDPDVPGSPILATLANRVIDALAELDPRWIDWRSAENHPGRVSIAKQHLLKSKEWPKLSRAERIVQVRNQLAPLVPSNDLISELLGDTV